MSNQGVGDRGSEGGDDSVHYVAAAWMASQHRVLAYLMASVGNFHDAEDLLQEVATVVLSSPEKVDRGRPFTAWCIGVARNLLRAHYRMKSRSAVVLDDSVLDAIAEAAVRVDEQLGDRQDALRECVQKLTDKKARVLRLRYEDDLKPAEIGKILGLSTSSVLVSLHRIRRSIEECINARLQRSSRR